MNKEELSPVLLAEGKMELTTLPKAVSIEVSTKCPLQCKYCSHPLGHGENMSWETFKELKEKLDAIPGLKNITFCGMGEAFMNPHIYEMIHELKDYTISLVTSGTIHIDFEKLNKFNNLQDVILSIDGTSGEKMKAMCGEVYNFNNLNKNLAQLKALKDSKVLKNFSYVLNCTLKEDNLDEIPALVDFAAEKGFVGVHYSIAWGSYDMVNNNFDKLKANFALAEEKAKEYGIDYFDPIKFFCCVNEDNVLPFIDMKGNIYPCGFGINSMYVAGNIYENAFKDVWAAQPYHDFNKGELCKKCCVIEMYKLVKGGF